ncbi:DUF6714 family protein [Pseudomonas sp. 1928-m]|uniref:DUF6714 family protein n=1 Tax=Pseudomonas sp. 1928-m TaxID=3033804 RepID=UPI0023E027F3|nr:DUF6714 family protein [Pseudomonas sp. 1928-m]MDF3197042.1 hypothetical protein [Pseudomonas sp. 1928-m]
MNWIEESRKLFNTPKPEHFTDFGHCEECLDHDLTLVNSDVDSIGFDKLGNPGWDPICYVEAEGFIYYFPAFVRLCVNSNSDHSYISQFLFHLSYDGKKNRYTLAFSAEQRNFTLKFLNYLAEAKIDTITLYGDEEMLSSTIEIWASV